MPSPEPQNVRVWDLPTRVFHWVLASTILCSIFSAKIGGNAMVWHFRFGFVVITLLIFRLCWGLVGGRWSRFTSFLYSPLTLLRYLKGGTPPGKHWDVGHNPLGSLSVFGLLVMLALQVSTGLFADDEISNVGPLNRYVSSASASLATGWHKQWGQWILLTMIALHLAAIVYYLLRKKINLVGPMIHGDKSLPPGTPASSDSARSRLLALAIAAVGAALVTWVIQASG